MPHQRLQNPVLMRDGEDDEGLRLLLIGKTGSGKSATGNTIFDRRVFESEMRSSSVTRVCQTHTDAVHNRRVTVIDTPDFIFSTHTDFDSDSELKRALSLCSPGAHVILLLLSLSTFTEQEMHFIAWFEQKFGEEALRFTLVLFTHADKTHDTSLEEMIKGNTRLSKFINRCDGGFYGMNNKCQANRRQVTELMEKIDRLLSENTNSCYTLDMMLEIEKRREEEERRREEEKEREHKMRLETVRRETEERVRKEYEQEILEKKKKAEEERETEQEMTFEIISSETVAVCDDEQSTLQESSWSGPYYDKAFRAGAGAVGVGAVVGGVGGAVAGGVIVAAVGAAVGAVAGGAVGYVFGGGSGTVDKAGDGVVADTDEKYESFELVQFDKNDEE